MFAANWGGVPINAKWASAHLAKVGIQVGMNAPERTIAYVCISCLCVSECGMCFSMSGNNVQAPVGLGFGLSKE